MEINHCCRIEQPDLVRTHLAISSKGGNEGVGFDHYARLNLNGEPLGRQLNDVRQVRAVLASRLQLDKHQRSSWEPVHPVHLRNEPDGLSDAEELLHIDQLSIGQLSRPGRSLAGWAPMDPHPHQPKRQHQAGEHIGGRPDHGKLLSPSTFSHRATTMRSRQLTPTTIAGDRSMMRQPVGATR
jgi:hypothetical protein